LTTPKVRTLYSQGSRFYVHPYDQDRKVPGVTSVLGMKPKGFLKYWAAKLVATNAVENWEYVSQMIQADPEGAIDYLKRAPDRETKKAADQGTGAHGIFEKMLLGQKIGPVVDNLLPFMRQFEDLLKHVDITPLRTEDTVWSDTHEYAGSFDVFAEVEGDRAWIDNKTTRSGIYDDVALQLSAYAHADYLLDGDTGEQLLLPQADIGLVFHVRPDFWAIYEPPIGEDVFEYFVALRKSFDWDRMSKGIIGKPVLKGEA